MKNPGQFRVEINKRCQRRIAFVLVGSDQGTFIVNRFDFYTNSSAQTIGVGFQILETGSYDCGEVNLLVHLLAGRRANWGDGVVAVDCGANIGIQTVAAALSMTGWGQVLAIEPQERIYYALAGNIALNNCFNVRAFHMAVGADVGTLRIPILDYTSPGSFGSLELRRSEAPEFMGQTIDYSDSSCADIRCVTIDSIGLPRLDVLKLDIEGMELDAIEGAQKTISNLQPIIIVEHIKVGWEKIAEKLSPLGYLLFYSPMNLLAVHNSDPTRATVELLAKGGFSASA